jgi:hypothetical protein
MGTDGYMEGHTFDVVGQEGDLGNVVAELTTYLLVRCLLEFGTRVHRVIVCSEEMFDVPRGLAVPDIREELELGLHTS